MTVDSGTFARSTTGSTTYLMNQSFTPALLFFFVTGKTSADTETHGAIGYYGTGALDGTLQFSSGKSSETRAKTLSHYAGTVEKIAFTVTSIATPGEFSVNYTAADVNYNIHWIAIG